MDRRHTYRLGKNPKNLKTINADTYSQAATIAARKLYGKGAFAYRVWGETDLNGYFQAYYIVIRGEDKILRTIGTPFYLQELTDIPKPMNYTNEFANLRYIRKHDLK